MTNPWNAIDPPSRDVNARRIDHTHPFDMFWAKDQLGHFLFIFEFSEHQNTMRQSLLPDLAGIKAYYLPATANATVNRLVLLLNEQQNWELFYSLCNDLVGATRQAPSSQVALEIILRRLARWHEFLKANRSRLLGEEKIKGLIGELVFLRNYLIPKFGAGSAVNFWQGPEGTPQDFCIGQSTIEVKCQSGGTRPSIQISSEFQLCGRLPEVYLFVVALSKVSIEHAGAITLPGLIADIRRELAAVPYDQIERFADLLYGIGYVDSEAYLNYSYLVTSTMMYRVLPGFPRVCPEDLPPGVSSISYNINLLTCADFAGQPDWMEAQS
jgi:hypothetical protein